MKLCERGATFTSMKQNNSGHSDDTYTIYDKENYISRITLSFIICYIEQFLYEIRCKMHIMKLQGKKLNVSPDL